MKPKAKKKTHKTKEIEMPLKFNPGIKKYEPDLDKLERIRKIIEEEQGKKPQKQRIKTKITANWLWIIFALIGVCALVLILYLLLI